MHPVLIVIAVFALLAFDLTKNDGEWLGTLNAFATQSWREIRRH